MNMKIYKKLPILFFSLYVLLVANTCFAQEIKKYILSEPSTKLIILEETFPFVIRKYSPTDRQIIPSFKSIEKQPVVSVELALIRYFSLLHEANFEQIPNEWSKSSQPFVRKLMNRPRSELSSARANLYQNSEIEFLSKIEYGKYILIEARLLDSKGVRKDQDTFAFENEDGRLKLTQDLADDPVMCCWKNASNRIRRAGIPGRGFPDILKNY